MALDIKGKNSVFTEHLASSTPAGVTNVTIKQAGEVIAETNENLSVGTPKIIEADKLAHISYKGKRVINLGNYQSASVEVGITMPTHIDSLDDSYAYALEWVNTKMEELTSTIGVN